MYMHRRRTVEGAHVPGVISACSMSIYCSIVVAKPHTCTCTPCKGHLLHAPHEGVAMGLECHVE